MKKLLTILILFSAIFIIGCEDSKKTEEIMSINTFDVDGDHVADHISLDYDKNWVVLNVKDTILNLHEVNNREEIFGNNPDNLYTYKLFIEGSKILIGRSYSFVNQFGTMVWLECYDYKNGELNQLWSSSEALDHTFEVIEFDLVNSFVSVLDHEQVKRINISSDQLDELKEFANFYEDNSVEIPEMELKLMTSYSVYDINGDGYDELVTKTAAILGASSLSDFYSEVYTFNNDGILKIDSWFNSNNDVIVPKK